MVVSIALNFLIVFAIVTVISIIVHWGSVRKSFLLGGFFATVHVAIIALVHSPGTLRFLAIANTILLVLVIGSSAIAKLRRMGMFGGNRNDFSS